MLTSITVDSTSILLVILTIIIGGIFIYAFNYIYKYKSVSTHYLDSSTHANRQDRTMITLELRGRIFIVERDLLIKVPGTYFSGMLSSGVWQPNR
jgi:hypothetical protein